jgi:hypothetical protein
MVYWIILGELFCIAFILCSSYIAQDVLQTIIRVLGFVGVALVPVISFVFYKWLRKDNAAASDELEQMVLIKAFAATGLVSISLIPFLLLFSSIFSEAAGYIALGYAIIIAATFKLGTFYLYKKY